MAGFSVSLCVTLLQFLSQLFPTNTTSSQIMLIYDGELCCLRLIAETQEMLDFCFKNNIVAEIEKIDIQDVNEAFVRLEKNDVKYRFVIDMASL